MLKRIEELDIGNELAWEPMRVVPPDPWVGHLPFAFWLVKALRPSCFVELGTHTGNSYFAFCQAMAAFCPGGRAFAVDTWQGDEHAGRYGEDVFAEVSRFNNDKFRPFSTLLRSTFNEARPYFGADESDLLHIDGMHSFEAVQGDFDNWRSALSRRGVVLFHDINVRERDFGVWRLWSQLRDAYPSFEFTHSHGLGVLGVGAEQMPALRALFALDETAAAAVRLRVASRGEVFQRQVEVINLRSQLANAIGQMGALEQRIAAAAGPLEFAQAESAWRAALLASGKEVIASKDALIATLQDIAAAREAALETRDQLLHTLEQRATRLGGELRAQREEQSAALARAEAAREAAERALQAAQWEARAQVAAVTAGYVNSTSWRLTRPLRVANRLLRGRSLRPAPVVPPLPPPPAEAAAPAPVAEAPAPPPQAFRALLLARLQAFLSGAATLELPRAHQPAVSIILVLYNQAELTFGCLTSIVETLSGAGPGIEVLVVDNGSTDLTGALLERVDGVTVIRNESNLHFLKAVNLAARSARGRTLLLLNNDAQLQPGALASALRTLDSAPDIGAVGGRIILLDGTLQEAGSIIWRDGACSGYGRGQDPNSPDFMFQRDVDFCSGAFLLTPTAVWRELEGFDERFAPAYYEEVDYCVRLWKSGRRVVFDPDAVIVHHEFGSAGSSAEALSLQATNHRIFASRHRDWLDRQFPASPANVIAARTARSTAPRILVLEDRVPKVELGTGYPRANRLLGALVGAGAEVTLFPMHRHTETWHGVRRALDKRVEVLIAAEGTQIRPYLEARRGHFDAILVCRPPNMATFQKAVDHDLDLIGDAAILYDAEALFVTRDLQRMEADGRPATDAQRHRMTAAEVALTRTAAAVISVSAAEQATLERYGARQVHLLSHAIDDAPIETGFAARDQVVFLGTLSSDDSPNADAVLWFAEDILPELRRDIGADFRLTVVGLATAPRILALDGSAIDAMGMVENLHEALARARVLVVPSRFAAGIPLKAYQAAMLGIPMVTTPLVASQLGWVDGEDLLVGEDAAGFAQACARLYRDRELWERLRENALRRARQDCSAEAFDAQVREILRGIRLVRRGALPPEPAALPPPPSDAPNTSRPAAADYSAAVPFGYAPPAQAAPPRLGVMAHLFHPEIAPEMLHYLRHLPIPAQLYLSTDTTEKAAAIGRSFDGWDKGAVEIRVLPNRGRDIMPKLVGFADAYADCDLVLHLHSKRSDHAAFLAPWRSFLFENLMGSPAIIASILDAFARLPDLGMVAPQHYEPIRRWIGWNGNLDLARGLATRMGITLSATRALDFPSGSMFWARSAALKPLLDLRLRPEDFPAEGAQLDHTPAHAIERLYFHVCERSGHSWMKVADPALYMDTTRIVDIPSPVALSRFAGEHGVMLGGLAPLAVLAEPAPLVTRVPPGLARRLSQRGI